MCVKLDVKAFVNYAVKLIVILNSLSHQKKKKDQVKTILIFKIGFLILILPCLDR